MDSHFDALDSKFSELKTLIESNIVNVRPKITEENEINCSNSVGKGIISSGREKLGSRPQGGKEGQYCKSFTLAIVNVTSSFVNQPVKSSKLSFTRTLPVKRITQEEMKLRRENGSCHYCDEVLHVGRRCKIQSLYMIHTEVRNEKKVNEQEWHDTEAALDENSKLMNACTMEIVPASFIDKENHQGAEEEESVIRHTNCSTKLLQEETVDGDILKDVLIFCGSYRKQNFQCTEPVYGKYNEGNMEQQLIAAIDNNMFLDNDEILVSKLKGLVLKVLRKIVSLLLIFRHFLECPCVHLAVITFMFDPGGCDIATGVRKVILQIQPIIHLMIEITEYMMLFK